MQFTLSCKKQHPMLQNLLTTTHCQGHVFLKDILKHIFRYAFRRPHCQLLVLLFPYILCFFEMEGALPATSMRLDGKQILIIVVSVVFIFLTVLGAGVRIYGRVVVLRKLFVEDGMLEPLGNCRQC